MKEVSIIVYKRVLFSCCLAQMNCFCVMIVLHKCNFLKYQLIDLIRVFLQQISDILFADLPRVRLDRIPRHYKAYSAYQAPPTLTEVENEDGDDIDPAVYDYAGASTTLKAGMF